MNIELLNDEKMPLQYFVLIIDLNNGSYRIPCDDLEISYMFDFNDYDGTIKELADLIVYEPDKEKYLKTFRFEKIKERFTENPRAEISFDYRFKSSDDHYFWFTSKVKKIKLTEYENENLALLSTYSINDYKILEKKDKERITFENHVEKIFDDTYEFVYDIDFNNDSQIRMGLYGDDSITSTLKRNHSDVEYNIYHNLIHPDDRNVFLKYGTNKAVTDAFKRGEKEIYYEMRRIYDDGFYHWNSIYVVRVDTGNEEDMKAICFIRDIDKKKKSEEIEIRAEEEKRLIDEKYRSYLNLIAANVNDVILIFNERDPYPLFVSSNIKRILGVEYKDIFKLFGRNNDICYDDFLYFYKKYNLNQKEYFESEIKTDDIITKKERWLLFKNYPVIVEDGKKRHILMISDLTDKKEQNQLLYDALKDAESANQTRSKFLSHMSHEIRTPLNAIIGLAEIAKSNIDNKEKVYDCMSKLDNSSRYLLNLINNVLDMSKIENSKISDVNEPFNLDEVINEATEIVEQLTSLKKQKLVIKNTANNYELIGNKVNLIRILMNVFSNASKFTPNCGKIEFEIYEILNTENKVTIRFIIKDNGIGMDKSFVEKIYEPFSQERQKNYSLNIYGTGLGMSITKNLVSLMDGNIFINSELGKGSEFIVDIPFKKSFVVLRSNNNKQEKSYDFSGKRILVAEDNELNLEIATELLEFVGFEVDTAVNGQVVIDKFNKYDENYYDAIIMDLQMPVVDGIEATYAVRSCNKPYAKIIPIVAMSANTNDIDIAKSLECGMNGHISKPVNRMSLYEELNKHINL